MNEDPSAIESFLQGHTDTSLIWTLLWFTILEVKLSLLGCILSAAGQTELRGSYFVSDKVHKHQVILQKQLDKFKLKTLELDHTLQLMKLKCLIKYAFVSIEYEMLEWPLWSLFLSHNKCHGFFSVEQKRAMSWIILKLVSLHAPITLSSAAAAAAKSLQSCRTLCDPIDGSPPGSPVPGILQARTLEWVAISFSNAWKWKMKVKSFSHVWLFATPWTAAYQAPLSMGFSRQEYWSGVPLPSGWTFHWKFEFREKSNKCIYVYKRDSY